MNYRNISQKIACKEVAKTKFLFEDGETIISEFIMRGTHKGEFIGITPTNRVIEMTGVDIDKIVNGKIVEHGGAVNTFDAFWENGLIKPV